MVVVQRGSSPNVTRLNTPSVIYIAGDESTDGSIRIIPDTSFQTEAEFQLRSNGVWNDTGILIAASTVYLGRELQISGGGEWMLTKDSGTDIRSLIPHVRFDAATGTEETVVVPGVGILNSDVILQPDDTGRLESSLFQFTGLSTDLVLANALILRTDTGGATDAVTVSLYRDGFGSGLFYQRTYPTSSFPSDSDIKLTTDGLVELLAGALFYIELSVSSGGFLDLKTDVTNTTPYFGGDFYFVSEDTLTPDEFGGVLSRTMTWRSGGTLVTRRSDGRAFLWSTAR